MSKRAYGRIPDKFDVRDYRYSPLPERVALLPASYDQRPRWPKPYDQKSLGSCTGQGNGGIFHYRLVREGKQDGKDVDSPACVPSRLFIYRQERFIEGTVHQDAGAEVRSGLTALADKGTCFEDVWPYSDDTTSPLPPFIQDPPSSAYGIAWHHKATKYERVNADLDHLRAAISADNPVVFGFEVYESFESDAVAQTGIVPMPSPGEKVVGGHCVVLVGYDDAKQWFVVRNSWGEAWGDRGYCYMPYALVADPNRASDFWVVDAAS